MANCEKSRLGWLGPCRRHLQQVPGIYVVDPKSHLVFRWTGRVLEISELLTSLPSAKIWERLEKALRRKG